ncbi:neuropeptide Y receptor type 2-like [Saccostrea cucullata]|uniref:neuropeptide Y receptor type 2-like n=1 Tax=Saccostrea cuccullata TaxID=36930 RepID=UPI002ED64EE4
MNVSNIALNQAYVDLVERERFARLPYGVLVLICFVIGIIGNSHVIHIFRKMARKKTPSELIIFVLALFDLVTLVLFIAKEYERMRYVMKNNFEIVCKISNYFGFAAGLSSSLFVLVLAIYRHQRLYNQGTTQTTVPNIIIKLVGCCVISALLSIPVPLIVGFQSFQVEGFQINRCWIAEEQFFASLPKVYFISLFVLSIVECIIIGVCYSRIAKILRRLKIAITVEGKQKDSCQREQTETSIVLNTIIDNGESSSERDQKSGNDKQGTQEKEIKDSTDVSTSQGVKDNRQKTEEKAEEKTNSTSLEGKRTLSTLSVESGHADEKNDGISGDEESESRNFRFTLTIFVISITIMLSYILFLSLYIFMVFKRSDSVFRIISVKEDAFYTYATDIVAVNAVIDPFVYFFSDKGYWEMVKSIYKRK